MTLNDDVAQGISASNDLNDQLVLGDMADEDTFEIPLKTDNSHSNNFLELSEELDSNSDIGGGNIEKKVRFEPGDEASVPTEHLQSRSRTGSMRGKKNVEDLLQYANQVNDYLAQNLENINAFRSELLSSDYPKPRSDMATQATPFSASMSNFELSDNESEEQETANSESAGEQVSSGNLNILNRSDDSLLNTVPKDSCSPESGINVERPSVDHTLENSPQLNDTDVLNSPELSQHLRELVFKPSDKTRNIINEDDASRSLILDHENIEDHDIVDPPPEEGRKIMQDTINSILKLSTSTGVENPQDQVVSNNEFATFNMKSAPTVTYEEFISRIQSKCMFGSIVYVAAAFLIQTLFLTRDKPGGSLILRLHLDQSHVHRLVVATIRVATKLLEDFVHSHQYFCKVCGVSKRLLTKLEVSLIVCLKHDGLVITSGKLAATKRIRDELMRNETK